MATPEPELWHHADQPDGVSSIVNKALGENEGWTHGQTCVGIHPPSKME